MPVFDKQLRFSNTTNPQEMISAMAKHIKYIQEQLEYTLLNLDSRNITEIDTDVTNITDTSGTTTIGAYLSLTGNNGEVFTAGKNTTTGQFEFSVKGKGGVQHMYLSSDGTLIITKNTSLSIDCGEW